MYEQNLYKIIKDHVKPKVLNRMNRYKKWEYGYNAEHDMIIISKTGEIGDVYEIQNLKIALSKAIKIGLIVLLYKTLILLISFIRLS